MTDHMYEAWTGGASSLDKYEGATDQYYVDTPPTERHGVYALAGDASYGRVDYPTGDGPQRGETWRTATYIPASEETAAKVSLLWAEQTPAVGGSYDAYVLLADHSEGRLRLAIRENAEYRWPDGAEADFDPTGTAGQWNEIAVDFGYSNEPDLEVTYRTGGGDRLARVVLEETTYDGGGWGYALWTTSGAEPAAWVDDFRETTPARETPAADPPRPPQNLRMTTRTASSVTVEWDHSPDADGGDDGE